MIEYTRKERKAINDGWSALMYLADEYRYDVKYRLKTALKIDAKERSKRILSKAVLIQSAVEARDYIERVTLDCIETMAHGCILATLVGYRMMRERPEEWERILPRLEDAIRANKEHTQRLLASCR